MSGRTELWLCEFPLGIAETIASDFVTLSPFHEFLVSLQKKDRVENFLFLNSLSE
jgi:hypothetical protein